MGGRGLCLVIEDDEDIAGLLEFILVAAGFDVVLAGEGVGGLRMAAELSPTLVTLDVGLPDMDGRDVATELRTFSTAPIIMVTAFAQTEDELTGIASGATAYLAKPFRPAQLRSLVDALVPKPETSYGTGKRQDTDTTH